MQVKKLLFLLSVLFFFFSSTIQAEEFTVKPSYYKDLKEWKYPQIANIENEKVAKKINRIFKQYIEKYYKEYKDNKKQALETDYQTKYKVKYHKFPQLNILTSNYIDTGGEHGTTIIESFNFDLEKGERFYVTDILEEEEQLNAVQDYVWEYAIERPDTFYNDLKKEDIQLTKDTPFHFSEEGIVLVFQQYEIAPYVSGNPEIAIPSKVYKQQMLK